MSDGDPNTSLPPSGAATPKGKLDSLSREDLVKFVKRQTILLQKMKAKNTELESQIVSPEGNSAKTSETDDTFKKKVKYLEDKLKEVEESRDEAVAAYNAVQMSQESNASQLEAMEAKCQQMEKDKEAVCEKYVKFERRNKQLEEEMECMTMKTETLTSTLQCLQQEQVTLAESNKTLIAEKSSLQMKIEDLEEAALVWQSEKEKIMAEQNSDRIIELQRENVTLMSKYEVAFREKQGIQHRYDCLLEIDKERKHQVELIQVELKRMHATEQERLDLSAKFEELTEEKDKLGKDNERMELTQQELKDKFTSIQGELDALNDGTEKKVNNLSVKIDALVEEMQQLTQENEELKSKVTSLEDEKSQLNLMYEESVKQVENLKKNERDSQPKTADLVDGESTGPGDVKVKEREAELMDKIQGLELQLEKGKAKLTDYETTLGDEFSIDVIQNLQQELADARFKISELEGLQDTGSKESLNLKEEAVTSPVQDSGSVETPSSPSKHGQVYTETLVKPIEVSAHVVDEENDVESLRWRIWELEKEREDLKNKLDETSEKQEGDLEKKPSDGEDSEVLNKLQNQRQRLDEKIAMLTEQQDTLTFELEEVQAERDSQRSEIENLQCQLSEWENMMTMLREEKEHMAQELEESLNRDSSLKKEMEYLMSSLNEAISERDSLQDEVFEMKQQDSSVSEEMKEMGGMIDDIIKEKNRLQTELDSVITAKADGTIALEGLKRELAELKAEKEDIEREKDAMAVRMELAHDKESTLKEDFSSRLEKAGEIESKMDAMLADLEGIKSENSTLKDNLNEANKKFEESETALSERKSYAVELESQILELSNSLADSKNRYDSMKEQLDEVTSNESEISKYCEKITKLETHNEGLEASVKELRSTLQSLEEQLLKNKDVNKALEKSLETTEKRSEEALTAVSLSNKKCEDLEEERSSLQQRLESLTNEKTQMFENLSVLQAESQNQESSLSSLKEQVSSLDVKLRDSEALLSSKVEEFNKCSQEKDALSKSCSEFEAKAKELADSLDINIKSSQDMDNEMIKLKNCVEDAKREIEGLKQNLALVEEENSTMRNSSSQAESATSDLLNQLHAKNEEISSLRENVSQAESLLAKEKEDIGMLSRQLEDLKAENESLKSKFEGSAKDKEELMVQLTEAQKDRNDYVRKSQEAELMVREMESDLNSAREREAELSSKVSATESRDSESLERCRLLEGKLEELTLKNKQGEDSHSETSEILKNVQVENAKLERQVDESRTEIERLTETLESAESEKKALDEKTAELENRAAELGAELSSSKEQCTSLQAQLSTSMAEAKKVEEVSQKNEEGNSKILNLRQQLKEKEDVNAKLKQIVIKTKKELGEKNSQLETKTKEISQLNKAHGEMMEENKNLMARVDGSSAGLSQLSALQDNYTKIQANVDALQDELDKEREISKTSSKDVEQLVTQLTEVKGQQASEREEHGQVMKMVDSLKSEIKAKESSAEEIRTKLRAADAEMGAIRIQLEEMIKEKQNADQRLVEAESRHKAKDEEHKVQLDKMDGKLKDVENQLTSAKQSEKQNNMLDLEIADYERTISNLNEQVSERDSKLSELKTEVGKQEETISLLQTQIDASEDQRKQAEDRGDKLKQLLVKTKKDLADAKKSETERRTADAQIRGQLESASQQVEDYKIQLSEMAQDNQRLQDKIRSLGDSGQRTVKSLEQRVQTLTDDLEVSRGELKAVHAEFDSYKVRAHSVLRQQKSKTPAEINVDQGKQEKERLEKVIEQLKSKLQENQELLQATKVEAEQLQEEHDRLAQRHSKVIGDIEQREASFKLRLEEVTNSKAEIVAELQEKVSSLEEHKKVQILKFKDQMQTLRDEQEQTVALLQRQLDSSEMENVRLQREIHNLQRLSTRKIEESISPHEFYPISAHPVEERQEGEGSEVVDNEPIKAMKASTQGTKVSFEQLLSTPMEELPGIKSPTPSMDEEFLKENLATSQKRIDHLTELLNESEESVSRLTEQAKILKDEIRRLERNVERERELQNMEYLKNIFLQFMCPKVGEQKAQLVPVLTTMLKLSPDEKARIQTVAEGDDQAQLGAQGGGWGSYLHRWSGLT